MAKRLRNAASMALILFLMVMTYISGSLFVLVGFGYLSAVRKNPDNASDYTKTSSFRSVTAEYMDAFYEAVSGDGKLKLPYRDDIAVFAYGLDTNKVYCSDNTVFDMPTFDEKYMNSKSYIYYLKYSSGHFRGNSKASGVTETFEYSYTDAAHDVFGNEQKYYADAAIILAVAPPDYGLNGYSYSRVEFMLLNEGALLLFICLGMFLVSFSLMLSVGRRRRNIDRLVANMSSWVYCEFKIAFIAVVVWFLIGNLVKGNMPAFCTLFVLSAVPVLYFSYCRARYGNRNFFSLSLCVNGYNLVKELYDTVAPVSDPQIRFRRRSFALMTFGIIFPVLFFVLTDIVLGLEAVRISIAVYIVLFIVIEIFIFKRYGKLLNDVCNLTSLTSVFALGGRLPETELDKGDDLKALVDNIRHYDEAVNAAAEMKFKKSNKRLQGISASVDEIKVQIASLQEMLSEQNADSEIMNQIRQVTLLTDEIQAKLMRDTPIAAPVLKRMDLLDAMDEVLNAKIAEFSAARLKIHADIPDPPAYITADYVHIKAALDILFTNTAMYAQAGTQVDISLKKDGQNWIYTIENEESPYAYAGAASADLSTGLTMAREYISINGGSLSQLSDNGRYSVTLKLPAAR